MLGELRMRCVQAGFFVVVIGVWYLVSVERWINPILFPRLGNVVEQLGKLVGSPGLAGDIGVTLGELAIAFGIAAGAGILLGYVVSASRYLTAVYEPMLAAVYAIPLIVFFPTFILFFGTGVTSKIAFGMVYGFFPIVLNTIGGFRQVNRQLRVVAASMGASEAQILRRVLLPAALPTVLVGLRLGFVACFASILAGEMLASDRGIGHDIAQAAQVMEMAKMFAYVMLVILGAFLFNMSLAALESRRRTGSP
jgi:ABC-type nitrate/sulfonate/bicarbonate transport system permease component